jgi:arabinan endo-1,5-alpha-L-arabinosidase
MTLVRLTPLMTVTAAVFAVAAALTAPVADAAPAVDNTSIVPPTGELKGDIRVHDPALYKGGAGQDWYVFSSGEPDKGGGSVQIRRSRDGVNWSYVGTIWDKIPQWARDMVPGAQTMWAPDISKHGDTYYLYYAVSTTGHNNSVIALATNKTLDPTDPAYEWVDQGRVVRSVPASNFNAIDPSVVEDASGTPWLVFGSYWSGIQMVQLQWPSGKRSADNRRYQLADRKLSLNAIEAPYIVARDGWFYLFTSWDRCCMGVKSNYKIAVGRSENVTGPYVDKDGRKLIDGGGTVVKSTSGNQIGPGGQSVSDGYIAYHYYDRADNGSSKLAIRQLSWGDDGWPTLTDRAA